MFAHSAYGITKVTTLIVEYRIFGNFRDEICASLIILIQYTLLRIDHCLPSSCVHISYLLVLGGMNFFMKHLHGVTKHLPEAQRSVLRPENW
jgi:hypothetical protein